MPIIVKRLKRFKSKSLKKSLHIIPFLFTFSNALLGLLSIIKSADGDFVTASYCLILAVLMDALDGRSARAIGCSSLIGMELDSLCDAISFCVAPAFLAYNWYFSSFVYAGPLVVGGYVCAGLFRLAKFNCTAQEQTDYFQGLPTPIAALLLVNVVLYESWFKSFACASLVQPLAMIFFMGSLAYLMICPLPFPSFKKVALSRMQLYIFFFCAIFLGATALVYDYPFMFFVLFFYVVASSIAGLIQLAREYE